MNLSRSSLSLIITFFSMSLIVLCLYNIHLGAEVEEEYIIEMSLEEETIEEILKEEEQTLQETAKGETIKSHLAFNETAKPSYGNPEPLKTLEEIIAEKETTTEAGNDTSELSDSAANYAASLKELAKKRQEKQQLLGELNADKEVRTSNYARRNTSVSYSLVDRNNVSLPVPIYTCIKGGKVVINIVVDTLGNVIDAELNKKSSSTTNGCLVENAIEYAYKSKFNSISKDASQKGSITYLFQSK